jgi:hypothetical protein
MKHDHHPSAQDALTRNRPVNDASARVQPPSAGDREVAHALALLEAGQAGAVTLAALRKHGIKAPVQAIYTLQLAGYQIERIYVHDANGHTAPGYSLHSPPATASQRSGGLPR